MGPGQGVSVLMADRDIIRRIVQEYEMLARGAPKKLRSAPELPELLEFAGKVDIRKKVIVVGMLTDYRDLLKKQKGTEARIEEANVEALILYLKREWAIP